MAGFAFRIGDEHVSRKKINYRWRCHACRVANAPQDSKCARCGCSAIASDVEIEQSRASNGIGTVADTRLPEAVAQEDAPPLTGARKLVATIGLVIAGVGVILERFTFPTMSIWYVALLMVGVGFLMCLSVVHLFRSPR
jgi:hypothetical protein